MPHQSPGPKRSASPPPRVPPESAEDWRELTLARLRTMILQTDPEMIEEMKWKKPSNPEGVPVWSHAGIVCVGNVLKRAVRLTFPDGARIDDPRKLFNTRLDSRTVRAVDFFEGAQVDEVALRSVLRQAIRINVADARDRAARPRAPRRK